MGRILKAMIVCTILLFSGSLFAEVPTLITAQGFLTNPEGAAVPNAEYSAEFSIYDVDAGGVPLWTETRTIGTVDGVFSIILGNAVTIPPEIFNNANLFLGITVAGDPELTPRQRLVTSPYSFHAMLADTAEYSRASGGAGLWLDAGSKVKLADDNDSVGIGVTAPAQKLHVNGQIMAGSGTTISGNYSTIGGGQDNGIYGNRSVIAGGHSNTITGDRGVVCGGYGNDVYNTDAFIGGGLDNSATGAQSAVGGGQTNTASGWQSVVAGGYLNEAAGDQSNVGGGYFNEATGNYSVVAGGRTSIASGDYSGIVCGNNNLAPGESAFLGGGYLNQASGTYGAVAGGMRNVASGYCSFAGGTYAQADDPCSFVWADYSTTDPFTSQASGEFAARVTGGVRFVTGVSPTTGVQLAAGGGSWSSMSDRQAKENFRELDILQLLEKLSELPITSWNYKTQEDDIRHIGPVAQEFYAAFGVGEDDSHITSIDADGVALAAIKALYLEQQKVKQQSAKVDALESELEEVREQLKELFERINK